MIDYEYKICGLHQQQRIEASLEVGKLYEIVADAEAESDDMICVIDEDGEDYLF